MSDQAERRSDDGLGGLAWDFAARDSVVVATTCVDIVGSTTAGSSVQIDLVESLTDLLRELVGTNELVVERDAPVPLPTGDGYILVHAGEHQHTEALRVAVSLLRHAGGLGLDLTIGVAGGECYRVPSRRGGPPQFIGQAVNIAARLQSLALPNQILVDQQYYARYLSDPSIGAHTGATFELVGRLVAKHGTTYDAVTCSTLDAGIGAADDVLLRRRNKPETLPSPDALVLGLRLPEAVEKLAVAALRLADWLDRIREPEQNLPRSVLEDVGGFFETIARLHEDRVPRIEAGTLSDVMERVAQIRESSGVRDLLRTTLELALAAAQTPEIADESD